MACVQHLTGVGWYTKIQVVKCLLDMRLGIDAKAEDMLNGSNHACYTGHIEIVMLLLDKRAVVNAQSEAISDLSYVV